MKLNDKPVKIDIESPFGSPIKNDSNPDPAPAAIAAVVESERKGGRGIHFGADRYPKKPHGGIDVPFVKGTKLQAPVRPGKEIFLIGIADSGDLGNALTFFVPDPEKPFFVLFAHLSADTFNLLKEKKISLGSRLVPKEGKDNALLITGESGSAKNHPHAHVTVALAFSNTLDRGYIHTADQFMSLYRSGKLTEFLRGKDFPSLAPLPKGSNAIGRVNPLDYLFYGSHEGPLVLSTLPIRAKEPEKKDKKPELLAIRP